jgi:hypothetical protein
LESLPDEATVWFPAAEDHVPPERPVNVTVSPGTQPFKLIANVVVDPAVTAVIGWITSAASPGSL